MPAQAVVTSVTAATSAVTIAAENRGRVGLSVYNDSAADLYLKMGVDASTTSFTAKLGGGRPLGGARHRPRR